MSRFHLTASSLRVREPTALFSSGLPVLVGACGPSTDIRALLFLLRFRPTDVRLQVAVQVTCKTGEPGCFVI